MKPRQTRIKVNTLQDGSKEYIPQHKGWLFWYDFDDWDGQSAFSHTNAYHLRCHESLPKSLSLAQSQIDDYIEAFNREEALRIGSAVKKTEYIKYP